LADHVAFGVFTQPGTGKTAVLQVIHRIAVQAGVPVLQMALSGRVVHRIREATAGPASTIAAILRYGPPNGVRS